MTHTVLIDGSHLAAQTYHACRMTRRHGDSGSDELNEALLDASRQELRRRLSGSGTQIMALDVGTTFRDQLYPHYKGGRSEKHPELKALRQELPDLARDCGVQAWSAPGYEADDLIAALTTRALNAGWTVSIRSGDQDLCALLQPGVTIDGQHQPTDAAEFEVKFGFEPIYWSLRKALSRDDSDNIPGVSGIGPKRSGLIIAALKDLGWKPEGETPWRELPWKDLRQALPKMHELLDQAQAQVPIWWQLTLLRPPERTGMHLTRSETLEALRRQSAAVAAEITTQLWTQSPESRWLES